MIPEWLTNPNPHELYSSDNYLVLDFETTNLDKGSALNPDNRLVLTCWKFRGNQYHNWNGEFDQQLLLSHLESCDFIVAHNAKFESQWLTRCGFDVGSKPWWDTFCAEWVLAGNRNWRLDLDTCLKRRGMGGKVQTVSIMMSNGVCPSEIPRSLLYRYCRIDVLRTEELFHDQRKDMERNSPTLIPITFSRSITAPVLGAIEEAGLHLDCERVGREYANYLQKYAEVGDRLDRLTGGINPRSGPQVREYVYGKLGFEVDPKKLTPKGAPKTDEATLLSLNPETDEQKEFLAAKKEFSQVASALDKNLNLFAGVCRERGGLMYATLNQGRAKTHRLTSSGKSTAFAMFGDKKMGCQFQNLPRVFKPLFSPRDPEWDFWEVDGSQLEFRVAGHLGSDANIRRDIEEGADIHAYTASIIYHDGDMSKVTKATRTAAKAHTFKPLYGGTSGTPDEVRYYKAFADKYAGLAETQEKWASEVAATKSLMTEWGMLYYWPHANVNRWGYLNVKTQVYNCPVQALATAEIIPIALVHLWHRTRDMEALLVNTVHDSVLAEVPPHEKETFMQHSVTAFTEDVYKYLDTVYNVVLTVPLGVGVKLGKNWSESGYSDDELGDMVAAALPNLASTPSITDGEISIEVPIQ